jgi:tRNA(fMet)-specific endonuclease VapC
MTAYLLDTTALIDFSKRREPAYSQINAWIDGGDTLAACAITVAEFYSGLSAEEARDWEELVTALAYWPIDPYAAMRAGQDRYRFARQGVAITIVDALLAALARERNAVLVTGNVKDYPMADLDLFPLTNVPPNIP